MRVLVTGGNGFIGRYVCHELEAGCDTPVIFDHHDQRGDLWKHRPFYLGDVRDPVAVDEAVAHADAVIHLAAVLGSQETISDPRPAIETNIMGAVNVLEACLHWDTPISMTSVGNAWLRSSGAGTYTIVKECAADLFEMYRTYRGLRGNLVRPTNAYGPFQSVWQGLGGTSSVRKILPTFINQALQGRPIEVYGDGEQVSDMCWVGDVAKVLIAAVFHAWRGELHPTAEVGPAEHMTVRRVAEEVFWQVQAARGIYGGKLDIQYLPMRDGERKGMTIADPRTLDVYGIELTPFADGLAKTVAHYAKVGPR